MQDRPTGPDALRERVFAGRARRNARQRRAAAAKKGSRRIIAVATALATVAGIIVATTLVSNAGVWRNRGGGGPCVTEPSPSASAEAQADNTTDTSELEAQTTVEDNGVTHVHYGPPRDRDRGRGWWRDRDRDRRWDRDEPACTPSPTTDPTTSPTGEAPPPSETTDPTENPDPTGDPEPSPTPTSGNDVEIEIGITPPGGRDGNNNGLEVLGRDCNASDLPLHRGFQDEEATCVNVQMGEAAAFVNNPSLLITDAPQQVGVNEPFTVTVSTLNLVRNRFLGAGAGGYYLESSFLDENGIQRGHFHFACTDIGDGTVAPTPEQLANPGFFVAVEDGGGGAGESSVDVNVPGLAEPGLYKCMAWAGDGSHRTPQTTFARMQTPVDAVRVVVE